MARRVFAWLIDVGFLVLVVFVGALVLAAVAGPTVRFGSDVSASECVSLRRKRVSAC